jgi:hypothetical protein
MSALSRSPSVRVADGGCPAGAGAAIVTLLIQYVGLCPTYDGRLGEAECDGSSSASEMAARTGGPNAMNSSSAAETNSLERS